MGIDPGSRLTGYGIVQSQGDKLVFVDAGVIKIFGATMPERIGQIFSGIQSIVQHHQKYSSLPMIGAIEEVFMAQNPDSALKLGQARGAAIAALGACGLEVSEYTARQIKQAVCGYGAADKEQVTQMVCRLLGLSVVPKTDAADGLACAICHAYSSHSLHKLLGSPTLKTTKKKGRWRLSEEDLKKLH